MPIDRDQPFPAGDVQGRVAASILRQIVAFEGCYPEEWASHKLGCSVPGWVPSDEGGTWRVWLSLIPGSYAIDGPIDADLAREMRLPVAVIGVDSHGTAGTFQDPAVPPLQFHSPLASGLGVPGETWWRGIFGGWHRSTEHCADVMLREGVAKQSVRIGP